MIRIGSHCYIIETNGFHPAADCMLTSHPYSSISSIERYPVTTTEMSSNQSNQPQTQNRGFFGGLSSAATNVTKSASAAAGGVLGTVGDTVSAAGRGVGSTLEQTTRGLGGATKDLGGAVGEGNGEQGMGASGIGSEGEGEGEVSETKGGMSRE